MIFDTQLRCQRGQVPGRLGALAVGTREDDFIEEREQHRDHFPDLLVAHDAEDQHTWPREMVDHELSDPLGRAGVVPAIHEHRLAIHQKPLQPSAPGCPGYAGQDGLFRDRREALTKFLCGANRQRDVLDLMKPRQRRNQSIFIAGRGESESESGLTGHHVRSSDLITKKVERHLFFKAAPADHLQHNVVLR